MKLHYFQDKINNFGDDLSPWLFKRLLPGKLNEDSSTLLVGLGTLLNIDLPKANRVLVFGSGVGYGTDNGLPEVDDTWRVYFVRGPLSAKALSLPAEKAVTDGAILLRKYFNPSAKKKYKYGYMPHAINANSGWQEICNYLGFGYVDAQQSVEKVIEDINACEILLTEAMHGAITADALRIPWIPVHTGSFILPFKWNDYCQSVKVPYEPFYLPGYCPHVFPHVEHRGFLASVRRQLKFSLTRQVFSAIIRKAKPNLSTEAHFNNLRSRVDEELGLLVMETKQFESK